MKPLQAVFIDRDGTIGGTGHFIHPRDFTLFEGSAEAIAMLKKTGLLVFAFTNQHRISRQQATKKEFQEQFQEYGFDDAFICPHSDEDACSCKKPGIGMLVDAAEKYGLELTRCAVIGDVGSTDMLAAHRVGALKILVRTGWGNASLTTFRDRWSEAEPDFVAENLIQAAEWLTAARE